MEWDRSERIETLQRWAAVPVDGVTGPVTRRGVTAILNDPNPLIHQLREIQQVYGVPFDTRISNLLRVLIWSDMGGDTRPPMLPDATPLLNKEGVDLILSMEGVDQPGAWPGEDSGITLGYGFDLGYYTPREFEDAWGRHLNTQIMTRLSAAIGRTGRRAAAMADMLSDIRVTQAQAFEVFMRHTLPKFYKEASIPFFGIHQYPAAFQTAMVSLVFNRGARLKDEPGSSQRREMRVIASLVPKGDFDGIARELRSMKRLWAGRRLGGLIKRRETEAQLVLSCKS